MFFVYLGGYIWNLKQLEYFTAVVEEGNISADCKETAHITAAVEQPDTSA